MLKIQSSKANHEVFNKWYKNNSFSFQGINNLKKKNYSPIVAFNSCKEDSTTAGVVKIRTKPNNDVFISTALTHQHLLPTDRCSQIMSPANGAFDTFRLSKKTLRDTDDSDFVLKSSRQLQGRESGHPCLIVLKSSRHLRGREKWKKVDKFPKKLWSCFCGRYWKITWFINWVDNVKRPL